MSRHNHPIQVRTEGNSSGRKIARTIFSLQAQRWQLTKKIIYWLLICIVKETRPIKMHKALVIFLAGEWMKNEAFYVVPCAMCGVYYVRRDERCVQCEKLYYNQQESLSMMRLRWEWKNANFLVLNDERERRSFERYRNIFAFWLKLCKFSLLTAEGKDKKLFSLTSSVLILITPHTQVDFAHLFSDRFLLLSEYSTVV